MLSNKITSVVNNKSIFHQPRVPVHGLANIVPPGNPHSKNQPTAADLVNAIAKKQTAKRTGGPPGSVPADGKNTKLTNTAENFQLIPPINPPSKNMEKVI